MNLPHTALHFTWHFVKKQPVKFTIFIVSSIFWALNDALYPYFIKRLVNTLQVSPAGIDKIYSITQDTLILLVGFWLLSELLQRTQGIAQVYTFPQFRADIRKSVFNYVKSHSHEYFAEHFAGNIAKRLADLPSSCQVITEIIFFQFSTMTVGAIVVLAMMFYAKPMFAGILLAWLCIHFGISIVFLKRCNHLWEVHSNAESTLSGKIVDVFTNILNVKLFARGRFESHYLKKYQNDEISKAEKAMWYVTIMHILLGLNGLFLIFSMVFGLLYAYSHQWITLGDFTQIGIQASWLLGWGWFINYQFNVFVRELGTISNALTLIRKPHDLIDKPGAVPMIIQKGSIQFEKVNFAYSKNQPVFKNLSVTIPAGQKVGLVGFSGSGKSTFVNLILRFYDLKSGRILIDGLDIAEATQDSLRGQIAMIPQDPSLFHRTLMENIRYGRLEASDEEVIRASQYAHCHEFIEKLDEGYQSLVGERGVKLSGGQRQRVAIARAILKNAPILILDEATSSLDSVTEKLIQESLHQLMSGRTTIAIAHRLSTLLDMDRILVFDKGEIVEDGSQKTLLKQNGHFAQLWNMQKDGFIPDNEAPIQV